MPVGESIETLKLVYDHTVGEWKRFAAESNRKVAHGATLMMKAVGEEVKTGGRRTIAAGGFSKKWQNAFRVNVYPKSKESTSPAIWAYHKIIYAGIFEKGGTIHGQPLLWLPVEGLKKIGRGKLTPEKWRSRYGPLVEVTSHNGNKLLLGKKSKRKKAPMEPIFVGLASVKIRKRFNLQGVFTSAVKKMPSLYLQNMKANSNG